MGAAVPNWREFRFKIDGKVGDEEITPLTLPMARLAEYLTDLAIIMGHKDSVHFLKMDDGSAESVMYVDEEEEARVTGQVQNAVRGAAPRYANDAYKRLDSRLREDDAVGEIVNVSKGTKVIEFPGRRTNLPDAYSPITERATVTGELKRVGGFDESIPIHLRRADGVIFYCDASPALAKELSPLYEQTVRVHGIATYYRENGEWRIARFRIQSFEPMPPAEPLSETFQKLRAIPGNEWNELDDPLEELRKLRHGEDVQP
jgi:hypothetical protein